MTDTRKNKRRASLSTLSLCLILGCWTGARQVASFGITTSLETRLTRPTSNPLSVRTSSSILFTSSSNDESTEVEEKAWDEEESLLVMDMTPLPDVSYEDGFDRVSQYVRSFPFAAVLPVQPLQQLPTDDGGLELKFLRKKTATKSGVDGGIRFFVKRQEEDNKIEILVKRNSDGQSIPKMFAEKLVVQSFAKGMALGSGFVDHNNAPSPIKVPKTRIESPTTDMVQIMSVFHQWL